MSHEELEPMEPEMKELLEAERGRPGMPDEARERLRHRLGLGGGGLGGARGGSRDPAPAPSSRRPSGWLSRGTVGFGAVTFVFGVGVGFLLRAALSSSPPAPAPVPLAPQLVFAGPPAPQTALPVASPPPVTSDPAPAPILASHHARPPSRPAAVEEDTGRDLDLAAERSLLEIARTALSRRQSDAALEALQRHAHEFPQGRLAEERESLWVQALVSAGRYPEARERGTRFRRRFPDSLLLAAVDAALGSIPDR